MSNRTLNEINGDTSFIDLSGNQITLPAGSYEIGGRITDDGSGGIYQQLKIRKVAKHTYGIPFKSFFQRLKYLFTGKLEDIVIIETKLGGKGD